MGGPWLNPEAVLEEQDGRPSLLHPRQPSLLSRKAKDKSHSTWGTCGFLGLRADAEDNALKTRCLRRVTMLTSEVDFVLKVRV